MEPATRTAQSAAGAAALRQGTCDPGRFTLRYAPSIPTRNRELGPEPMPSTWGYDGRRRCRGGSSPVPQGRPDGALFTVSDTKGGRLIQRIQVDCADQVRGRPQACAPTTLPRRTALMRAARHRLRPQSDRRRVSTSVPLTVKDSIVMSKAKAKAKQVKGKLKETAGDAMGNKGMQSEGRSEQLTGKAQETAAKAAERLKKSGR